MTSSRRPEYTRLTPDADLIAAIKKGNLDAFTALVDRHQRSLINFFYHCAWDRQVAEDCTQEVFLKLYMHLGTYEPKAKFTTFLYRVARNLWIDKLRASKGKMVSLEATSDAGDDKPLKDRIRAEGEMPVETLTRQEAEEKLKRAIDVLPDEQRMVVTLSELQGMKYQEIAEILDVPVGTIKSRMFTAMNRLKELLSDEV